MFENKLYSINEITKILHLSKNTIELILQQAEKDLSDCFTIVGKRKKIFLNEFINYIKGRKVNEVCQKKKDFIKEEDFGGFHTPKKEYNSINQLKARLLMKQ